MAKMNWHKVKQQTMMAKYPGLHLDTPVKKALKAKTVPKAVVCIEPMLSKYRGACPVCGSLYYMGTPIVKVSSGWAHDFCAKNL